MDIIFKNNTGRTAKNAIIDGFVAYRRVLDILLFELRGSTQNASLQCYLIIGERGIGKTMFLWRLKFAIEDDPLLNRVTVPIMFGEEQYFLEDLTTLWCYIAAQIEDFPKDPEKSTPFHLEFERNKIDEQGHYHALEKRLKEKGKKVFLFIENIDKFFNKIGKHGQQRLREILSTSSDIRIIGSAMALFNEVTNYRLPFYGYFKVIQLNGLTFEEATILYRNIISQSKNLDKEVALSELESARIEVLRRLTNGNPRMLAYVYQGMQNGSTNAVFDIYLLTDVLTLQYNAMVDQLSHQQQKMIDFIGRSLDAVSVKEIVSGTGMESKYISSILSSLQKIQMIDRVQTKTKNHLYRMRDRMLNMWYIMRYGTLVQVDELADLIRFCEVWCAKRHEAYEPSASERLRIMAGQFSELNYLLSLNSTKYKGSDENECGKMASEEMLQKISSRRFDDPIEAIAYATQILNFGYFEAPCAMLTAHEGKMAQLLNGTNETKKQILVFELLTFFIRLLSKKQYYRALQLFDRKKGRYRAVLRPVYFACLRKLKEEYPTEVLKSSPEIETTIQEVCCEMGLTIDASTPRSRLKS